MSDGLYQGAEMSREIDRQAREAELKMKLETWWCLSYASWLTLPRALIQEMPAEWQGRLADLLREMDAAFPNVPPYTTRVRMVEHGKYVKSPSWLNYRRGDPAEIDSFKAPRRSRSR